jgi:predicted AAA+ superfamily ATPase
LISTEHVSKDGKEEKIILKSEQDVFEQIKQIDLPLVIVAVVGLYRTGKSYLMNCLAKSSQGNIYIMNKIVICKMLIVRTT